MMRVTVRIFDYEIIVEAVPDIIKHRNGKMLKKYPMLGPFEGNTPKALHTCDHKNYPAMSFITLVDDYEINSLAHEAVHAADLCMEWYGFEGTEIRAKIVDQIISKCLGE